MMKNVIYEKAGRIRIERYAKFGEQWKLITRLVFPDCNALVDKFPRGWRGSNHIQLLPFGQLTPWDLLSDDLMCE